MTDKVLCKNEYNKDKPCNYLNCPEPDERYDPQNCIEKKEIATNRIKLLIAIPSNTGRSTYSVPFVHSLIKLCAKINNDEVDFDLKYFGGLSIDIVRLQMCRYAVENEFDIIVMLDDDMSFPDDTIIKFIKHYKEGKKIVGGIYQSKAWPFHFFLNRANTQIGVWDYSYEEGVHKVKAFGTGCLMIATEIFEHLHQPYFLLRKDVRGNITATEDCFFALNCYVNGFDAYIDTSILCQHIKTVTFPDFFTHPKIGYDGKFNKHLTPNNNNIGSIWEDADALKKLGKNYKHMVISPLKLSFFYDGIDECSHSNQLKLPVNEGEKQKYKCKDCSMITEGVDPDELLKKHFSDSCPHHVIKHGKCMNCEIEEEEI